MKELLLILLSVIMLFSFAGCESDDDSQELSKVESELADIEEVLGKVANDYLNADITKSEAEEKLDILESRVSSIEIETKNPADFDVNNGYEDYFYGMGDELSYSAVRTGINSFQYNLRSGKTDAIIELRDMYYKE